MSTAVCLSRETSYIKLASLSAPNLNFNEKCEKVIKKDKFRNFNPVVPIVG